jgi:hypothetical protein
VQERKFYSAREPPRGAEHWQPVKADPVEPGARYELVMVVFQGKVGFHVREVLLVSLIQNGIFKCVVCNGRHG